MPDGNQECVNGFCFDKVCSGFTKTADITEIIDNDATTTNDMPEDGTIADQTTEIKDSSSDKEKSVLEPLDKASVKVDGSEWTFELNMSASYVAEDQRLQISMNNEKNGLLYQLEIHCYPIEEFIVGHWTTDDPGEVTVEMHLNDGTGEPGDPNSWKYTASQYDVTIEEFGAVGGRIKGSFSGVLADKDGGASLTLTDGHFDIKRKN